MNRLIVGNWKHNPGSLAAALDLAEATARIEVPDGVELVACPPLPYLSGISALHPKLVLGVQDLSAQTLGAHTGEVGADILKSLGVRYAIVGHSERRAQGESNEQIAAKAQAASDAGILPIICVGESRDVREQGTDATRAFLQNQLDAIPTLPKAIVAYEPVWAIGTGIADDPANAVATARFIAGYLAPRIADVRMLYGASVAPENAAAFFSDDVISGLLVGGASLDAEKFAGIVYAR